MTTSQSARTVPLRPVTSSLVPSFLTFTGLTTVIVGILAMHVWMGGHGSTSHHVTATATTVTAATTAADDAGHAAGSPGHAHDEAGPTVAGALTPVAAVQTAATDIPLAILSSAAPGGAADAGMPAGCGGDCADEMMLGMCVLVMIVAGIAWLLAPAGGTLLSMVVRRGPPVLARTSRPAPTPSLTQLCIRRT